MPAEDVTVTVTYEDISSEDKVTVIAHFDEDQYSVRSSTNWDWNFSEGFTMDKDATFYMTVYDNYGENFYVGVKIGDTATTYPATIDEDSGEYSFGKAFVATGNVVIKVGPTESSVAFSRLYIICQRIPGGCDYLRGRPSYGYYFISTLYSPLNPGFTPTPPWASVVKKRP